MKFKTLFLFALALLCLATGCARGTPGGDVLRVGLKTARVICGMLPALDAVSSSGASAPEESLPVDVDVVPDAGEVVIRPGGGL